jgi:hypothetical protein
MLSEIQVMKVAILFLDGVTIARTYLSQDQLGGTVLDT